MGGLQTAARDVTNSRASFSTASAANSASATARARKNQLGALGLVVNLVVLWNTIYMDAAVFNGKGEAWRCSCSRDQMQDRAQWASPKQSKPREIRGMIHASLSHEIAQFGLDHARSCLPRMQRDEERECFFVASVAPIVVQHVPEWTRQKGAREMVFLEGQMWKADSIPPVVKREKAAPAQSLAQVGPSAGLMQRPFGSLRCETQCCGKRGKGCIPLGRQIEQFRSVAQPPLPEGVGRRLIETGARRGERRSSLSD